ncbi:MAG: response regulator transcription factor [Acidobacteriota bacterium]|jgi:DNA-binding response OmpR family regulator
MARILAADDDPIVQQFVSSILIENGHEVFTAPDGEQALEQARTLLPDVLVLDLIMPYKDGYEVLRSLQEAPETRNIPVIILSAKSKEEDIIRGLEGGAEDFIIKPFNALELVARVKKVLARTRG